MFDIRQVKAKRVGWRQIIFYLYNYILIFQISNSLPINKLSKQMHKGMEAFVEHCNIHKYNTNTFFFTFLIIL